MVQFSMIVVDPYCTILMAVIVRMTGSSVEIAKKWSKFDVYCTRNLGEGAPKTLGHL